jgi:hypothetical protein
MDIRRIAASLFAVLTALVVLFQLALVLGAPWGAYAMGGAVPGQFPPALRVSALLQGLMLLVFVAIVLARAGVAFFGLVRPSRWLIWVVVAVSAVSLVLNLITPSAGERLIWLPVLFVLLATSLLVATGPVSPKRTT